jgi:hypothetical protein
MAVFISKRKNMLLLTLGLITLGYLEAQQKPLEEEVFAITSDEYVMPGELLWIEARVTHQGKPTPSKVLYLELLNREGVPVVQEMAPIKNGMAEGYLPINDLLPSDYYLLRAYTKVSPYFSVSKGMHHQFVAVINPLFPPKANLHSPGLVPKIPKENPGQNLPLVGLPVDGVVKSGESVSLRLKEDIVGDVTIAVSYLGDFPPVPVPNFTDLYAGPTFSPIPQPEIFGHIIQGRVLSASVDTTVTHYLSAHGKTSKLMISKPLPDGKLIFEAAEFQQFDFVIVQSEYPDSPLDFMLDSPFWPEKPQPSFLFPSLQLSENLIGTLQNRLLANQTSGYFYPESPIEPVTYPPFLVADYTYLMDDYNRFDDMATVIREYVPTVLVRRENRKTIFKNVNKPASVVFQNNPLILIDAMPILDSDAFSKFNPKEIKQMDIVNREFYLDHKDYDGVINLTSFENDFGKFDLPKNTLFIAYKGLQIPRNTELARGKNTNRRSPDFRPLRAWCRASGTTTCDFDTGLLSGKFQLRYIHWQRPLSNKGSIRIDIK